MVPPWSIEEKAGKKKNLACMNWERRLNLPHGLKARGINRKRAFEVIGSLI